MKRKTRESCRLDRLEQALSRLSERMTLGGKPLEWVVSDLCDGLTEDIPVMTQEVERIDNHLVAHDERLHDLEMGSDTDSSSDCSNCQGLEERLERLERRLDGASMSISF